MIKSIKLCIKNEAGEYVPVGDYVQELEEKVKWLQGKKND